jgi:hypothetical protein
MQRNTRLALTVSAGVVAGGALALGWRAVSAERQAERWDAAIQSAFDTSRAPGWVETFRSSRPVPLSEYDARWQPLFGRLVVDPRLSAAVGDAEGGWQRDGGDDYAFRLRDTPRGSVEITVDGWWDGIGSIGVQGAVQDSAPHQLYEAALWRGTLSLVHFIGPAPDRFEVLAEAPGDTLGAGHYRIQFCLDRRDAEWAMVARLLDPDAGYAVIREVRARDGRLGEGGQGIGLLGGGGRRASYVTGMAVRDLAHPHPCSADATP